MNEQPVRNRAAVLALEIVPGLFGILGLGWLFAGFGMRGVLLILLTLIAFVLSCAVLSITAGAGLFCVIPLHLVIMGVSAWKLHLTMQDEQHRFV